MDEKFKELHKSMENLIISGDTAKLKLLTDKNEYKEYFSKYFYIYGTWWHIVTYKREGMLALLGKISFDDGVLDYIYEYPVLYACQRGNVELLKYIIQQDEIIKVLFTKHRMRNASLYRRTCFLYNTYNIEIFKILLHAGIIELEIKNGPRSSNNLTVLNQLITCGKMRIAQLLMEHVNIHRSLLDDECKKSLEMYEKVIRIISGNYNIQVKNEILYKLLEKYYKCVHNMRIIASAFNIKIDFSDPQHGLKSESELCDEILLKLVLNTKAYIPYHFD